MTAHPFQVGVAVGAVPVPVGTPMSGFAARSGGSVGTHDPMTVRALVVDRVGVVAVDCCALHERTCALVRERALASGLLDEVVVAATHTHAGPSISEDRLGQDQPAIRESVVTLAVELLAAAARSAVPCTARHGATHGLGIAHDRRHLDRPIDPALQAIWFERIDAAGRQPSPQPSRIVTLVSFPCHPVVLDASNRLVSADYIGPLRDRVEQRAGGVALFLTGAAGDVNTGHSAQASFVVGSAPPPERTFAEAARVGHSLADTVVGMSGEVLAADEAAHHASDSVTLDLRHLEPERLTADVATWQEDLGRAIGADQGDRVALLSAWLDWAARRAPDPPTQWTGRVGVLRLGLARVVFLPGEPFLSAADRLAEQHDGPMITVGYSDGVPGYLPALADQAEGGYEVDEAHRYYGMPAPFAAGGLERLEQAAAALLEEARR